MTNNYWNIAPYQGGRQDARGFGETNKDFKSVLVNTEVKAVSLTILNNISAAQLYANMWFG